MHPLCSKRRIPHPLGIGGKVANSLFWDTLALAWGWSNGGQSSNSRDQCFNVAVDEQITGVFGPNLCGLGLRSIDRPRYLPHMFLSVVEIHNLDRARKVFLGLFP
jgi:hypothetical protein